MTFYFSFIGDSGVGKRSIMASMTKHNLPDPETVTLWRDSVTVSKYGYEYDVRLITSLQPVGTDIPSAMIQNIDICFLVFDVTNEQSFNNIPKWKELFDQKKIALEDHTKTDFFVVANGIDKPDPKVEKEDLNFLIKTMGVTRYMATSATQNANIDSLLETAVTMTIHNRASLIDFSDFEETEEGGGEGDKETSHIKEKITTDIFNSEKNIKETKEPTKSNYQPLPSLGSRLRESKNEMKLFRTYQKMDTESELNSNVEKIANDIRHTTQISNEGFYVFSKKQQMIDKAEETEDQEVVQSVNGLYNDNPGRFVPGLAYFSKYA